MKTLQLSIVSADSRESYQAISATHGSGRRAHVSGRVRRCWPFVWRGRYWNQGYASEAGQAFVEHSFLVLGLRKIHAAMNARNLASQRVIEKLGFRWVRSGGDGQTQFHDYELLNESGG